MQEKENVLRILQETLYALEKKDDGKIMKLSNQTINTASLTQDPDNIAVAVIVYSIGKIVGRENYRNLKGWDTFYKTILSSITNSINDIKKNDEKKFRKDFELIRNSIENLSGKLKIYVGELFRKASINKASKLYEHGISMGQTAKLLGITMFELANYIGQAGISDIPENKTSDVKSRIKLARDMFR